MTLEGSHLFWPQKRVVVGLYLSPSVCAVLCSILGCSSTFTPVHLVTTMSLVSPAAYSSLQGVGSPTTPTRGDLSPVDVPTPPKSVDQSTKTQVHDR